MSQADQSRREAFLQSLRESIAAGKPILGAGAGTGLVAKAAQAGGADFIGVYCTSRARHRGFPTSIIGDPNEITLELVDEVSRVVKETPIIAGLHATDPSRSVEEMLEKFRAYGCVGVINYPSMGLYGREYIGGPVSYEQGLEIEKEAMKLTREMGLVAMTYVYRPEEAAFFAPVVDVMVAHAGWTVGGMAGAPPTATVEEAAEAVNQQVAAAKATGADIIFLGHGGPFSGPEDTHALYQLTDVVGFVGASSIERIPVERAVKETVEAFKAVPLKAKEG